MKAKYVITSALVLTTLAAGIKTGGGSRYGTIMN